MYMIIINTDRLLKLSIHLFVENRETIFLFFNAFVFFLQLKDVNGLRLNKIDLGCLMISFYLGKNA